MFILKSLLTNKSVWIIIVVLSIFGYATYKFNSLVSIIEEKEEIIKKDKDIISNLNRDLVLERVTNNTNKENISNLKKEIEIQNNKVRELSVNNDNITKILEEHKKDKPSKKVIVAKEPVNLNTVKPIYTKYKGIKYEDL